jgi:hypothetical protein
LQYFVNKVKKVKLRMAALQSEKDDIIGHKMDVIARQKNE